MLTPARGGNNNKIIIIRETSFLFQRISMTIQHFNSVLLHDPFSIDCPDQSIAIPTLFLTLFFNPWDLYYQGHNNNNNNNNNTIIYNFLTTIFVAHSVLSVVEV